MKISPLAAVSPGVCLSADVEIGPFAVVGAEVELGAGTRLHSHAVVLGPTRVGARNEIHSFAVIGGEAQSKRDRSGSSALLVGDANVFREHVTVHRGTGGRATSLGSHNLFMAGSHVAHDASLGDHVVVANAVQIAGHTVVEDHVTFGGLAGVAQFVRVGEGAFLAAGAMCESDVPPYVVMQGDRARVRALNLVGLERRRVPAASVEALGAIFRAIYFRPRGVAFARALEGALAKPEAADPFAARLLAFLKERGSKG